MLLPRMMIFLATFAMSRSETSGPFPVAANSEVEIKGGAAKATSHYNADWTPDNAFILGHATGWHNGPQNYGMFPELIWYEFPAGKTFVPARVSFRTRKDGGNKGNYLEYGPTVWQFVGSNDESCGANGRWSVLCEDRSDAGYRHQFWTKYCDVADNILSEFKCLGISILNVHQDAGAVAVKDVRFWKKEF